MSDLVFTQAEKDYLRRENRNLTDEEFEVFMTAAMRYGLNPLQNQIHAVVRSGQSGRKMTLQTGIDGYRLIADRTGKYAGSDDAVFEGEQGDCPACAKVTIFKMVEGQRCAFSASARMVEYRPAGKAGYMWGRMPHVMLAKCAEALALRKGFPAELAGLYTQEEMAQAGGDAPEPVMTPAKPTLKLADPEPGEPKFIPYTEKGMNPRADAIVRGIMRNSELKTFEAQLAASNLLMGLGVNANDLSDDTVYLKVIAESKTKNANDWRNLVEIEPERIEV